LILHLSNAGPTVTARLQKKLSLELAKGFEPPTL
jgi:hypothetical protein